MDDSPNNNSNNEQKEEEEKWNKNIVHFHIVSVFCYVARLPDSLCAMQYFKQASWLA